MNAVEIAYRGNAVPVLRSQVMSAAYQLHRRFAGEPTPKFAKRYSIREASACAYVDACALAARAQARCKVYVPIGIKQVP